ncbi:MAG: glycosyltransferase family 39 protein [Candidatus Omnitrophica bacterium]|nr:glycosyltransferase family 39 protein [Candidatus Omnitrophota bacterium]
MKRLPMCECARPVWERWKKKISTKKLLLLAILLIAAFLRLVNLYSQSPNLFSELGWVWSRRLNYLPPQCTLILDKWPFHNLIHFIAEWFLYALGYMFGFFKSVVDFDSRRLTDVWMFLFTGRMVNALFGIATVYVAYLIGKQNEDENTGLLSALFLSVMYLHVRESRFIAYRIPLVFFVTLAFLFLLRMFEGKRKYYLLTGFLIGLGGAIKPSSFVTVAPFLLAHVLRFTTVSEAFKKTSLKPLFAGIVFIALGFFAGYPLFFKNLDAILFAFKHYSVTLTTELPWSFPDSPSWSGYVRILYESVGLSFLIPFVAGAVYSVWRKDRKMIVVTGYVLCIYICLCGMRILMPYYTLYMLPFIAFIGASFLGRMKSYFPLRPATSIIFIGIILVLISSPVLKIFRGPLLKASNNREKVLKEFLETVVPPDKVLLDDRGHLVDTLPIILKISDRYYSPKSYSKLYPKRR